MLLELKVSNFAIINSLHIDFRDGLNILSGETGTGKSVLLRSLSLLMGEKAAADTVRTGADSALIEGSFDLSKRPDLLAHLKELGVDIADETLVVRRLISGEGKNRVYLNGHLSALNNLRDVVSPLITLAGHVTPLIELTGQHDNRNLQSKAYHLDVLDHYTGCMALRQKFSSQFARWHEVGEQIGRLELESRTRDQRLDFLLYQRDEIKTLNLVSGEDETLTAQISRLRNSARLSEFNADAQDLLYGSEDSVLVKIHHVLQRAAELKNVDETLANRLEPLSQAKSVVEDVVYELRNYGRELNGDPEELNHLEERLSQIRRLQKKFGPSVDDVLANFNKIEEELRGLTSSDERLRELRDELEKLSQNLTAMADDLHVRRANGAQLLAKGVNDELLDLNMRGVTFGIAIERTESFAASGNSDIEFTIQSSKKDAARPLAKVASGGELSRILLSLKRVVGHSDLPRTYLFDEVDAGVSGVTAEKVGRKLKAIAHGQQVICVTHLPQVAAFADVHFLIDKLAARGNVEMKIVELKKTDRVREIARLISGEKITQSSLDHARELLK